MLEDLDEEAFENSVGPEELDSIPEDYREEYVEKLQRKSERLREEVESLPDDKGEYFDQFVEECNEIFDVNFVDYEHNEDHKQDFCLVLEDENGGEWEIIANPLNYAQYELSSGMNYVEFLKLLTKNEISE